MQSRRFRRAVWALSFGVAAVALAGCDYFAEKRLVPGVNTEGDVRMLMGQPDMIWEEPNGAKKLEYPRGPQGVTTYFVHIAPDGKFQKIEQVLVESNFAKIKVGMTRDDVRRELGRQTETTPYALSNEEVWSWRYAGDNGMTLFFNAHFDRATGLVKRISRIQDWKTMGN
ncbi:MAG: hypothetical protein AB7G13_12360 [Lautropia sp.]